MMEGADRRRPMMKETQMKMTAMERDAALAKAAEGLRALACLLEPETAEKSPAASGDPGTKPEIREPEPRRATLEQARAVLAERAKEGMGAQVRMLLGLHGAERLSGIAADELGMLAAQGEKLDQLAAICTELEARKAEGLGDRLPALFGHHFAAGLGDLDPDHYGDFLRDAKELAHAR